MSGKSGLFHARSRIVALAVACGVVAAGLAASAPQSLAEPAVKASQQYQLRACVNKKTLAVRIVVLPQRCSSKERGVPVNTTGGTPAIRYGAGAPAASVGLNGDFYIDITNYDFYGPREAGNWGVGQSLIGPDGQPGEPGPRGATGSAGPMGPAGAPGGFGGYGNFDDTATVPIAFNSATEVPLRRTVFAQGVSIQDSTKITMDETGVYNIAFSLQLFNSANTRRIVTIWLSRNGTAVPDSAGDVYLGTATDSERNIAAWNFFVEASPGDYFELMIATDGSTGTPPEIYYGPSVNSAIGAPAIPSTILTVNQVG